MPEKTVLFHSTNTIGVGHMARSVAMAVAVRDRHHDLVPFMAVEGSDHGLFRHYGLSFIRFPDRHFIDDGRHQGPCSHVDRENAVSLMCQAIVNALRPCVAIFDLFPSPYFVENIHRQSIPYCVCVREGQPAQMRSYFERNATMLDQASALIVPHAQQAFKVPSKWDAKAHCVGQIVRPRKNRDKDPSTYQLVITGGGGGFPGTVDFYNLAIEAFSLVRERHPQLSSLLVTGPLFQEWRMLELAKGLTVIPFTWDLQEYVARASLVLCQGGYNTIGEVLQTGCPVICVPGSRGFDDQVMRAESVARSHDQVFLFRDSDPRLLALLMDNSLARTLQRPSSTIDSPGAQIAADLIANLAGLSNSQ